VRIWIFDDSFNKKGPILVILVRGTIQSLGPGSSLVKYAFEAVEAIEVAEASEVNEAAEVLRPETSLLMSHQDSGIQHHIDVLKNSIFLLNFSTFSVRGC
jgi:SpoU rRNA methylase family enzyme